MVSGTWDCAVVVFGARWPRLAQEKCPVHFTHHTQTNMRTLHAMLGLLICGVLGGCAHRERTNGTFTTYPGAFTSGGVTYYPAHPGNTNYGAVDYTTNPPPAGVRPVVVLVTTNAVAK